MDCNRAEALARGRATLRAKRERGESVYKNPIEKATENPTSRQAAINCKCFDCEGQDADPGWRWRIGNCTAGFPDCGIWNFRPYQNLTGTKPPAGVDPGADSGGFDEIDGQGTTDYVENPAESGGAP